MKGKTLHKGGQGPEEQSTEGITSANTEVAKVNKKSSSGEEDFYCRRREGIHVWVIRVAHYAEMS
jgi:1,2-phenylacetyl-CoA epoxidase PaaB subunit